MDCGRAGMTRTAAGPDDSDCGRAQRPAKLTEPASVCGRVRVTQAYGVDNDVLMTDFTYVIGICGRERERGEERRRRKKERNCGAASVRVIRAEPGRAAALSRP